MINKKIDKSKQKTKNKKCYTRALIAVRFDVDALGAGLAACDVLAQVHASDLKGSGMRK